MSLKDNFPIEAYLPVVGYEGMYEVSNLGNVRSVRRVTVRIDGIRLVHVGRTLKSWVATSKYPTVQLTRNAVSKSCSVHRLVAIAFLNNPHNFAEVNHINGDKLDNRLENLEWCDKSHNQRHSLAIGLRKRYRGASNKNSKITQLQAINIMHLKGSMPSHKIGELYGVSGHYVRTIQNGGRDNWIRSDAI